MLQVGGLMESLIRTRVSSFTLGEALTLSEIEACRDAGTLASIILPVDRVFESCQALHVTAEAEKKLSNGNRLTDSDIREVIDSGQKQFRLYDSGERFYGLYERDDIKGGLKSRKMFL
jgi:tRNA pseudouridine55 synthase